MADAPVVVSGDPVSGNGARHAARPRRGYLAACAGALVGSFVGGVAGLLLGGVYSETYMPDAELEGLTPLLVGGAAGAWVAAAVGIGVALWVRRYPRAGRTAAIAGVILPFSLVAFVWVGGILSDLLAFVGAGPVTAWVAAIAAPAAAARAITIKTSR